MHKAQAIDAALTSLSSGGSDASGAIRHPAHGRAHPHLLKVLLKRKPWYDRLPLPFRKVKPIDPVWINKSADLARARDSFRYREMEEESGKEPSSQAFMRDLTSLEKAWKDAGEGGWANKWGPSSRSQSRWVKE
jgi:hypothetical protein